MRRRRRTLAVGAALALGLMSCGQAAAVFFDLPPAEPSSQSASVQPTAAQVVLQTDTVRPLIESVHDRDSLMGSLPKHITGGVDWIRALREGIIAPRSGPPGSTSQPDMRGFAYDFVLKGDNAMFDVRFPHSEHVRWLACANCHPGIFKYRDEQLSMQLILEGEACGRCHGPVAFPPDKCARCHTGLPATEVDTTDVEFRGEFVLARGEGTTGGGYPTARFSHGPHRVRYQCSACHPALFEMRAGSDTLTMDQLSQGEACGACHDGVNAFSQFECLRCHVAPEPSDTIP